MITYCLLGLFVSVVALVLLRLDLEARRSLRAASALTDRSPDTPVTVIIPVKGADDHTESNFRAWAAQKYEGPFQLILSFQDPEDPALAIARRLEGELPLEVLVNPIMSGCSGKMSNLLHGVAQAHHPTLVFSDSDIQPFPDTLSLLCARLGPEARAVSCVPRLHAAQNLWARIQTGLWNMELLSFVASRIRRERWGLIGGTCAFYPGTLAALGGLERFRDYLIEDYMMGVRARELGMPTGYGPVVNSPVGRLSFAQLRENFSRAALFSTRVASPREKLTHASYLSYLFLLLGAGLFQSGWLLAAGFFVGTLRLLLASHLWRLTSGELRLAYECHLGDLLAVGYSLVTLYTHTCSWRGVRYRVASDGRVERV